MEEISPDVSAARAPRSSLEEGGQQRRQRDVQVEVGVLQERPHVQQRISRTESRGRRVVK